MHDVVACSNTTVNSTDSSVICVGFENPKSCGQQQKHQGRLQLMLSLSTLLSTEALFL